MVALNATAAPPHTWYVSSRRSLDGAVGSEDVQASVQTLVGRYDRVYTALAAPARCTLRDPRDSRTAAAMREYADAFATLAPGGFDPHSQEDEQALVALVANYTGRVGAFGARWAPSLRGLANVHHVTQHWVGTGATRYALHAHDCAAMTATTAFPDVSHLLSLAVAQIENVFRDIGFMHGVLEEGCHFLARGRTAAQLEASFWPWGLSSNACGTLLSDATYAWQCNHGLGHALAIFHGTGDGATKSAAEWEALQRSLTACGFLLDHMEVSSSALHRPWPATASHSRARAAPRTATLFHRSSTGK